MRLSRDISFWKEEIFVEIKARTEKNFRQFLFSSQTLCDQSTGECQRRGRRRN